MGKKPTVEGVMAAYATDAVDHARANFGVEKETTFGFITGFSQAAQPVRPVNPPPEPTAEERSGSAANRYEA